MAPKGKKPPPRGAGPGARPAAADPGIDIVFDKPKPKSRGHRQRSAGRMYAVLFTRRSSLWCFRKEHCTCESPSLTAIRTASYSWRSTAVVLSSRQCSSSHAVHGGYCVLQSLLKARLLLRSLQYLRVRAFLCKNITEYEVLRIGTRYFVQQYFGIFFGKLYSALDFIGPSCCFWYM